VTYLGVSPPVRSGAANPWAHDRSWTRSAYNASHTNLQALRELDSTGESFLRAGGRPAPRSAAAPGGARVDASSLVLASPDPLMPCSLSAAAALEEGLENGCCASGSGSEDEERLSDAGSEAAAGTAPFALPAPASDPPRHDLGRVRTPFGRAAGAAPTDGAKLPLGPPPQPAAQLAPQPMQQQQQQQRACGKQHALEPFACHTQYYV
jgi:hypothetical protein